ncbi:FAD-dependent oxidoreductase [Actinocrispum wychmicini]|uniref:2-polyprenyl-6-methoxyphenol hydroxylase-like FAD-dependent oxidoreductase n=1 Tax=Actinocrispum wychmicini TaxID=1213861 RepID=A0A4R2K286_9PSEU|nr:FAD-dependent oxidoreductase [Actinocrispum wychmicini]TCO65827.1 2-polyprenyl-6-methoxyphenol hydroxylase-like FAD-dependent oxidoreductase [Actinocrispum wychmicini]
MIDVLVVGAGPTGLALACDLARRGVDVRVIDKAPEPFGGSRGKGLQERSLEVLADLGVIDEITAAGWDLPTRIHIGDQPVREVRVGGAALLLPQWSVEKALRDKLRQSGVRVEFGVELVSFAQSDSSVVASVPGETIEAKYMVGCDGGRSVTRKALGVAFDGETAAEQLFLIADAEVSGLTRDATHMWIDPNRGMFAVTPFPATRQWQIQVAGDPATPTPPEFQRLCREYIGSTDVTLSNFTWMSAYRPNVRMVDRFRVGRVFLAGDAAHVHPPTGGLGMNTGIQDAYNLGWKLARAVAGTASPGLLDTYQDERLPVAEWTLATSTQALMTVVAVVRAGSNKIEAGVKDEHRQLDLAYPNSPLSKNLTDWTGPRAGDRSPWADKAKGPDFTLLAFAGEAPTIAGVRTHLMPKQDDKDVLVLVRPDGHIGMVATPKDVKSIADYVARP